MSTTKKQGFSALLSPPLNSSCRYGVASKNSLDLLFSELQFPASGQRFVYGVLNGAYLSSIYHAIKSWLAYTKSLYCLLATYGFLFAHLFAPTLRWMRISILHLRKIYSIDTSWSSMLRLVKIVQIVNLVKPPSKKKANVGQTLASFGIMIS